MLYNFFKRVNKLNNTPNARIQDGAHRNVNKFVYFSIRTAYTSRVKIALFFYL